MNDNLRLIVSDQPQQLENLVGDWATAELCGDIAFLERNLATGALVTGILLSIRTPWGLVRHYWVLVKFVLTVALVASSILIFNRRQQEAVSVSEGSVSTLASADVGALQVQIIVAVSLALLLLVTAITLYVYKPWGRTWFGRRKVVARRGVKL